MKRQLRSSACIALTACLLCVAADNQRNCGAARRIGDHDERTATWDELRSGDDHQVDGTLTFRSNGTGHWSCTTWTDHTRTGDKWHSSFTVLDAHGHELFKLGTYDSPREDDGHPSPRYSTNADFQFDRAKFNDIAIVIQHYSA